MNRNTTQVFVERFFLFFSNTAVLMFTSAQFLDLQTPNLKRSQSDTPLRTRVHGGGSFKNLSFVFDYQRCRLAVAQWEHLVMRAVAKV